MAIEEDPPAGVPDWIVSFGDMMSLLLCFFVLLFSMGSTEQQKFQAMAEAMQEKFGDPDPRLKLYPRDHPPLRSRKKRMGPESWDQGQEPQTSKSETNREADEEHRMWMQRDGHVPTIGAVVQFAGDQSQLTDDQRRQLDKVGALMAGKANLIAIRGHTNLRATPPGAEYRDDWELAFWRCRETMQYLVETGGLERERFRLEVVGRNEPVYRGSDPLQLKRNSRVELFLLNDIKPSLTPAP